MASCWLVTEATSIIVFVTLCTSPLVDTSSVPTVDYLVAMTSDNFAYRVCRIDERSVEIQHDEHAVPRMPNSCGACWERLCFDSALNIA